MNHIFFFFLNCDGCCLVYMINVLDFAANGDMPLKVVLEICEDSGVFLVFSTLIINK
jgi:hypothetical protein